jgi:putative hydrolase of the HAD superfamily
MKEQKPAIDYHDIDCWIFDLDNTLYPVTTPLLAELDSQMSRFVANFLGVDGEEARKIQKAYFHQYGLTLRGLMIHHNLDPEEFFSAMTPTNLAEIKPNPNLGEAIKRLPGRKLIYTNSYRKHAEMVLVRLKILDAFEDIFDITAADFIPKPNSEPYQRLCQIHSIKPENALMVDDIARNLEPAGKLGMTTVWMQTKAEWATTEERIEYVDFEIRNIDQWVATAAD